MKELQDNKFHLEARANDEVDDWVGVYDRYEDAMGHGHQLYIKGNKEYQVIHYTKQGIKIYNVAGYVPSALWVLRPR